MRSYFLLFCLVGAPRPRTRHTTWPVASSKPKPPIGAKGPECRPTARRPVRQHTFTLTTTLAARNQNHPKDNFQQPRGRGGCSRQRPNRSAPRGPSSTFPGDRASWSTAGPVLCATGRATPGRPFVRPRPSRATGGECCGCTSRNEGKPRTKRAAPSPPPERASPTDRWPRCGGSSTSTHPVFLTRWSRSRREDRRAPPPGLSAKKAASRRI